MAGRADELIIRNFREADARTLAALFNSYIASFFGPIRVTEDSWREQFRDHGWNAPSVDHDERCIRVAERRGQIVGYAVTDYEAFGESGTALVQELCVVPEEDALEVMDALLEDAERRAASRGKSSIAVVLSDEDRLAAAAAEARGYDPRENQGDVFMAAVTNLAGLMDQIADELSRRQRQSEFRGWSGTVKLTSGRQECLLSLGEGRVEVAEEVQNPDIAAEIGPDWLPLLMFGRETAGELYTQDALSIRAENAGEALRLLDALFPRLPIFLPRAQWW